MTAFHQSATDLTAQRFGDLLVTGRAGTTRNGTAVWACRCPRGHQTTRIGSELRRNEREGRATECTTCHGDGNVRNIADYSPRIRDGVTLTCAICHGGDHDRRTCPERKQLGRLCGECSALPHRRERPVCPGCGERFMEEPPVTIEQQFEQPNWNRREII